MSNVSATKYILGHSPAEIQRLMSQAVILRPITERLLRSAGIEPGMRVLEVGCGAGDVSMLAAELVGSAGSVVGIDRNAQVLAIARERAQMAKFGQIDFKEASIGTYSWRPKAIRQHCWVHPLELSARFFPFREPARG